ncbi:hypothetical protein PUNSTDRAFT_136808 [Punctularia strigosozonata HHB-11173 SS5]|uniref:uncharacterized protein n=1 Tax=Punctularia strigosozonata (strain HHB-11173) TaxID=741275 RepID=UPI00044181D8|nr:uncharacterized protein PUNSTDRAFT_136808 [Punctularia strigosozonata HHB-11173 SS5]EIN06012.1 hypothetical protein PUNSTDRAFT_136808 [Punctularia strigosozonata HHB-11173 SS5]
MFELLVERMLNHGNEILNEVLSFALDVRRMTRDAYNNEEQDHHRLEEDIATAAAQLEARTAELRLVELQQEEASRGIKQYRKDIQSLEGVNAQLQLQLTATQQRRPSRVSKRNLSLLAFTLKPTASPLRNPFDKDNNTTSQPALTGAAGLWREMTLEEPQPMQIRRDRAKNERLVTLVTP